MPIISSVGRRAPRVRLLVAGIYAVLVLGSVTMVYPLLIMVAGSTKSGVDVSDFSAIPRFLYSDTVLYRKHIEGLFNESLDAMNMAYDSDVASFEVLEPPANPNEHLVAAWREFLDRGGLAEHASALGYTGTIVSRTVPRELRLFKHRLIARFDGDVDALNRELGTEFVTWNSLFVRPEDYTIRRNRPPEDRYAMAFGEFKGERGHGTRYVFSIEGFYKRLFLKPQYTRAIEEYNRLHGTAHASYREVHLPPRYPESAPGKVREDWEVFVRNTLNLLWVHVDPAAADVYRTFLRAKYGTIAQLNERYGTQHGAFEEIPLTTEAPTGGVQLSDWESLIAGWHEAEGGVLHRIAPEHLVVASPDIRFREWLTSRYGTLADLNRDLGTAYASMADILPPQREFHWFEFLRDRKALRLEFCTRNYRTVLDYMVFHGRGIFNTVVYCSLAIVLALIVNPLAAYAMSRFRMPTTYKILLFLLLTMAFPPMVTQIPVFLMLRQFGLLNTFAALLLPGMANGYSVFLLKGFFDSLGQELYESAQIDGASEWVMFWNITMALSKPILAVIALNTFTMAYSNFMFALLLCQDERMWTLMVWLYQLQRRSGLGVVYASLIIAGIPTLLVFVFCQNIIMRGIVVPVEK
ncbi:MAG: ABC transporter permease subunit [Lentisphaeria bacterium]|nr:ABC transporter permease subunit [Lentisphaeria bacterium]